VEQLRAQLRSTLGVHRRRPARQDQRLRPAPLHVLGGQVMREQLGEDAALAHAPRYELRVLPSEVEHQHFVRRSRERLGSRLACDLLRAHYSPPRAGSADTPFDSGCGTAAAVAPIPMPCSCCSCLPSDWSAGATMTSALWKDAMSSKPQGAI